MDKETKPVDAAPAAAEAQPIAIAAPVEVVSPEIDVDAFAVEVNPLHRPLLRSLRLSPRSRDAWKQALDEALKARI